MRGYVWCVGMCGMMGSNDKSDESEKGVGDVQHTVSIDNRQTE